MRREGWKENDHQKTMMPFVTLLEMNESQTANKEGVIHNAPLRDLWIPSLRDVDNASLEKASYASCLQLTRPTALGKAC